MIIQSVLNQAILDTAENEPHEGHYWLKNPRYYFLLKAAAAFEQSINPEVSQEEREYWERLMWFRLFCIGC